MEESFINLRKHWNTCQVYLNYFRCIVLNIVKVYISYAQGLVQLLRLIFTFIFLVIGYLYEILRMQPNNWMNIHLKRGKTTVYQNKIFTVNVGLS